MNTTSSLYCRHFYDLYIIRVDYIVESLGYQISMSKSYVWQARIVLLSNPAK
jgi:hypothetical protein